MERERPVKKRAQKACGKCREDKVKCTGSYPCQRCVKRKLTCDLNNELGRSGIPKRNLRKLKLKTATTVEHVEFPRGQTGTGMPSRLGTTEQPVEPNEHAGSLHVHDEHDPESTQEQQSIVSEPALTPLQPNLLRQSPEASISNPLAVDCSNYFSDVSGRPIHLGTSSNWSFGRRVLLMLYEKVKHAHLPPDHLHFDGTSYDLGWNLQQSPFSHLGHDHTILPSMDHARHLINSVKFHCGQLYHLFDEDKFMQQFDLYHENKLNQPGLWYCHYLFLLAFGKAFVVQKSKERKPAGAEFFILAMNHLPNFYFIVGDYIELVQIMCCAALYLHCVDFRGAAYRMIGHALRVALEDGMHTEMHSQDVNDAYAQRCRRVWWTVYILDRQMSSLMGVPVAISDDSIHAALPNFPGDPQKSAALHIQIKLSQVLGHILNGVYGAKGRLDKQFLRTTRDTLKEIANVTDQLNTSFPIPQNGSTQGVSRTAASLHLLHHQCIVLTTRPLLYSLLQTRLGYSGISLVHSSRSGSVRTLSLMCIDSSQRIMDILVTLQEQSLLESFLRSDLDVTFTSTITLLMTPVIDHSLMQDSSLWVHHGYAILDNMISRGNMVAVQVKSELQQLEDLFSCLAIEEVGTSKGYQQPTPGGQFVEQDGGFEALSTGLSPPVTIGITPTSRNHLQMDETFWQDGLTTEQLINFANSMDITSLDFL